jgi:5-hydroxyisourate hydrolase-like protein (transthyretin family)
MTLVSKLYNVVLDSSSGKPAAGVVVNLHVRKGPTASGDATTEIWEFLASGFDDSLTLRTF